MSDDYRHLAGQVEDGIHIVAFIDKQLVTGDVIRQIEEELLKLTGDNQAKVIINMKDVEAVTSAMLGTLIVTSKAAAKSGGDLFRLVLSHNLWQVFDGIDVQCVSGRRNFWLFKSLAEAREHARG